MRTTLIIMGIISLLFGCKKAKPESLAPIKISDNNQHDKMYKQGSERISPHMLLAGRSPKLTPSDRRMIAIGIHELNAVTEYNQHNWPAFWIKGKGHQVLGNKEAANSEFRKSYELQKDNPDVAREYAMSCLELAQALEAIDATKHAIKISPNDAGLYANLALAYLISAQNKEAESAISQSLSLSPKDGISQNISRIINDVIAGKRKQPHSMSDLGQG